jgi:hypothetical protein
LVVGAPGVKEGALGSPRLEPEGGGWSWRWTYLVQSGASGSLRLELETGGRRGKVGAGGRRRELRGATGWSWG